MPFIGTDIRVIDPGTDEDIPIGETGDAAYQRPDSLCRLLGKIGGNSYNFEDGWLHTGIWFV
jgi:hypothetical protein